MIIALSAIGVDDDGVNGVYDTGDDGGDGDGGDDNGDDDDDSDDGDDSNCSGAILSAMVSMTGEIVRINSGASGTSSRLISIVAGISGTGTGAIMLGSTVGTGVTSSGMMTWWRTLLSVFNA